MRILALDLAQRCGWARVYSGGQLRSGVVDFRLGADEHPGARWVRVRQELGRLAAGVEYVAWERIVPRTALWAASHLFGIETQLVEVTYHLGVKVLGVAPNTLKKFATGNGRAKKPQMLAAARRKWPRVTIATHDQADALWVLAWARKELAA